MLSRVLAGLTVVLLGIVVLFAFFAALGGFEPGDVLALSIGTGVLMFLVAVHAVWVRHHMDEANHEVMDPVNSLRERRGF